MPPQNILLLILSVFNIFLFCAGFSWSAATNPLLLSSRSDSGGNNGWGWGHSHGHHHHHVQNDQNLDLYSLLGGLSFASLLGATIIYLARRNASGRRRRRSIISPQGKMLDLNQDVEDDTDETLFQNGVYFGDIIKGVQNLVF